MSKKPLLSIIIPTKNEEVYLPKVLDSIKSQSIKNIEIIVADAHSSDNTVKIAKKAKCRVVSGGFPDQGRNNGAKVSKSDTLLFLDADTLLSSIDFLKSSLEEMNKRNLDISGVYLSPIKTNSLPKNILYSIFYSLSDISCYIGEKLNNPFVQSAIFSKKNVHKYLKGFPPYEFGEDSAYAQKAIENNFKVGMLKNSKPLKISPRRFEKSGFFRLFGKYIWLNLNRIFGHEYVRGKSNNRYWD